MQADPTVFVIDDDEAMRDSLAVLLESAGYSCRTFDSARTFLDSGPGDRPGCIVTDVRMPDMTGLELQQELGRRRIATPLIILTGYGNVAMAVAALRAGAVTFLEKP
ncbi:MAG: response regulator transcription factor, partial [Rhodospirillales bacterium]|nr:response regulator transcription factor [Rhodospirillales bacterium]